jgi:hypothetical protein
MIQDLESSWPKSHWRFILTIESAGLIVLWPVLFYFKSLSEPKPFEYWFLNSVWAPWLVFTILEALSVLSLAWNYKIYKLNLQEERRPA